MRALIFGALLLQGAPALADAWPVQPVPNSGRLVRPQAAAIMGAPTRASAPTFVDGEGQRYTAADVALGFLPVPTGYQRSGGGLVRTWTGAPASWSTPGVDAPAAITPLMSRRGGHGTSDTDGDGRGASCERGNASFCPPKPPKPPKPEPPIPHDPPAAPGPLGLGALASAFAFSRKLRRRIHS